MFDEKLIGAIGTLITGFLAAITLLYTAISKGRVDEGSVIIKGVREEVDRLNKRVADAEAGEEKERNRADAERERAEEERDSGQRWYAFCVAWWSLSVERHTEANRRISILRAQVVALGGLPAADAAELPPLPAPMLAILKGTLE